MFKISYRRKWFWRTYKIKGFSLDKELDRMTLYFEGGALLELAHWNECDCKLGEDYFSFAHKKMEQSAGQSIPVNR